MDTDRLYYKSFVSLRSGFFLIYISHNNVTWPAEQNFPELPYETGLHPYTTGITRRSVV